MPARSKKQQKFMGMVYALKKGEIKPSQVSARVREAAKSMTASQAKEFAGTRTKGLPTRIKEKW